MQSPYPPFIKFLGTGGGRRVMAFQSRATGGFLIGFRETLLHIDPGPGALVHLRKSRPSINPSRLTALLISHRHIDHSSDASALIEAMTEAGKSRDKWVFLPGDALEPHSILYPHVLSHMNTPPVQLKPHAEHKIGDILLRVSCQHLHPVETYGFHFFLDTIHFAYIADTAFFEDLIPEYRGIDVALINVTLTKPIKGVQHLTLHETLELLVNIRPKIAIFTHFGPPMLKLQPWKYTATWSHQAGCRIIAAQDGRYFEFHALMNEADSFL